MTDEIQRWFTHGGADGFNFFEALPNTSLKDFVEMEKAEGDREEMGARSL